MSVAAIGVALLTDLPGASVGAAALSTGVVIEALVARWMARASIRDLLAPGAVTNNGSEAKSDLTYLDIAHFYLPLALTSLIGIAIHPMLTFFMGRAVSPVESLAVFPVVHSLGFIFRAIGLSFQDAVIALMGNNNHGYAKIRRFGLGLGLALSGVLGAVAFTPLSTIWFELISGLTPELAAYAIPAARIMTPVPFLGVLLSLQRGTLMKNRRTHPIIIATAAEVSTVAVVFIAVGWGLGWVGVTAAFTAFFLGRLTANLYLTPEVRRVLRPGAVQ